jgi:hypothetical protein
MSMLGLEPFSLIVPVAQQESGCRKKIIKGKIPKTRKPMLHNRRHGKDNKTQTE